MRRMRKVVNIDLDFQNISQSQDIPELSLFNVWILAALKDRCKQAEIAVRIVDPLEMQQLNARFRGQNKPTNVLAFPLETVPLVGDIVICASVVADEAQRQKKEIKAHWAHLTVHGVLHLLGYDHLEPAQAELMEGLEVKILKDLNFSNPYEE